MCSAHLAFHRTSVIQKIMARSEALKVSEQELHANLHPDLQKVLAGKNTILWEQLLREYEFPDPGLVDEVRQGLVYVNLHLCLAEARPVC